MLQIKGNLTCLSVLISIQYQWPPLLTLISLFQYERAWNINSGYIMYNLYSRFFCEVYSFVENAFVSVCFRQIINNIWKLLAKFNQTLLAWSLGNWTSLYSSSSSYKATINNINNYNRYKRRDTIYSTKKICQWGITLGDILFSFFLQFNIGLYFDMGK